MHHKKLKFSNLLTSHTELRLKTMNGDICNKMFIFCSKFVNQNGGEATVPNFLKTKEINVGKLRADGTF